MASFFLLKTDLVIKLSVCLPKHVYWASLSVSEGIQEWFCITLLWQCLFSICYSVSSGLALAASYKLHTPTTSSAKCSDSWPICSWRWISPGSPLQFVGHGWLPSYLQCWWRLYPQRVVQARVGGDAATTYHQFNFEQHPMKKKYTHWKAVQNVLSLS